MTIEEALAHAWTRCCPSRLKQPELPFGGFPTGFWPDVARVALYIQESGDPNCPLPFTPTHAGRANDGHPRTPGEFSRSRSRGKLSAQEKAANTLALLAKLKGTASAK